MDRCCNRKTLHTGAMIVRASKRNHGMTRERVSPVAVSRQVIISHGAMK